MTESRPGKQYCKYTEYEEVYEARHKPLSSGMPIDTLFATFSIALNQMLLFRYKSPRFVIVEWPLARGEVTKKFHSRAHSKKVRIQQEYFMSIRDSILRVYQIFGPNHSRDAWIAHICMGFS